MKLECAYCGNPSVTIIDGDACCKSCYQEKMRAREIIGRNIFIDVSN
jgi:hypothetical protein